MERLNRGTGTDVRASFSMALGPRTLALASFPPASLLSWGNRVVDWAVFPVKRTKNATKRTRNPLGMRDPRGRALHSLLRDIADLRARRPRADGTYINNTNPISLASGRTVSKATLFNVLHWGGWFGLGATFCPLNAAREGVWPAIFDVLLWAITGGAVSLAIRVVLRRARAARLPLRYTAVLVLALSIFGAAIWYELSHALNAASLVVIMRIPALAAMFGKFAAETARDPWLIPPLNYWSFFACTMLTWCSLYFGINAMLDLEI